MTIDTGESDFLHGVLMRDRASTDTKLNDLSDRVALRHKNVVLDVQQSLAVERAALGREVEALRRELEHVREMRDIFKSTLP
jgi:Ribonuclease G/E